MDIKSTLKFPYQFLNQIFNPITFFRGIWGYFWYTTDLMKYRSLSNKQKMKIQDLSPCLHNKGEHDFDPHYFYMSVWAYNHIYRSGVHCHVDIGSQLIFAGLLSSVTRVIFIDIRPLNITLERFEYKNGNILQIPYGDQTIVSLSSLHVAEHIGLGRYGDPIDPAGTRKAIKELSRVIAPHGTLYFAVPVGKPRTCFNAHRIFNPVDIIEWFKEEGLVLTEFSAVGDDKKLYLSTAPEQYSESQYACGMFCFTRL